MRQVFLGQVEFQASIPATLGKLIEDTKKNLATALGIQQETFSYTGKVQVFITATDTIYFIPNYKVSNDTWGTALTDTQVLANGFIADAGSYSVAPIDLSTVVMCRTDTPVSMHVVEL